MQIDHKTQKYLVAVPKKRCQVFGEMRGKGRKGGYHGQINTTLYVNMC